MDVTRALVWFAVGAACVAVGCDDAARAQPAQPTSSSGALAPVRCYELAADTENVAHLSAMQLCTGAASDAPARCFAAATDTAALANLQAIRLCTGAASTAPAACAERLATTTDLSTQAIVRYCAAMRWALGPSGAPGTPACIELALDQTALSDLDADRLCRGSRSTAPVQCYQWGATRLGLGNQDLVSLCAAVVVDPTAYDG